MTDNIKTYIDDGWPNISRFVSPLKAGDLIKWKKRYTEDNKDQLLLILCNGHKSQDMWSKTFVHKVLVDGEVGEYFFAEKDQGVKWEIIQSLK